MNSTIILSFSSLGLDLPNRFGKRAPINSRRINQFGKRRFKYIHTHTHTHTHTCTHACLHTHTLRIKDFNNFLFQIIFLLKFFFFKKFFFSKLFFQKNFFSNFIFFFNFFFKFFKCEEKTF